MERGVLTVNPIPVRKYGVLMDEELCAMTSATPPVSTLWFGRDAVEVCSDEFHHDFTSFKEVLEFLDDRLALIRIGITTF